MKTKITRRLLLTVGLALAMVGASSLPAAAVTTTLEITTGTITIGSDVYDLGSSGTPGVCDVGGTSSLTPDVTAAGAVTLTAADYVLDAFTLTGFNGVSYKLLFIGNGTTAGAISNTGAGSASLGINMRIEVQPCAGGTPLCRTRAITGTVTDSGAGYSGSLPPAVGDTVHLEGTSNTITTEVGCNTAIRFMFHGKNAFLDLDFVVV